MKQLLSVSIDSCILDRGAHKIDANISSFPVHGSPPMVIIALAFKHLECLTHVMALVNIPGITRLTQFSHILVIRTTEKVQLHSLVATILTQGIPVIAQLMQSLGSYIKIDVLTVIVSFLYFTLLDTRKDSAPVTCYMI